jgi:hypothetical protein
MIVTSTGACASAFAQASPPKPAPMITIRGFAIVFTSRSYYGARSLPSCVRMRARYL